MADTKITALTALTAADPANDVIPIVDVSDTTMAASGTTKKISVNNILGASGTATLASATITGDLTVDTSTLKVDSANNYVGIGTASPVQSLTISGEASVRVNDLIYWNGYYNAGFKARATGYAAYIGEAASGDFVIANTASSAAGAGSSLSFLDRYRISNSGVHTWEYVGGVAGTAMTLNSTGLIRGASSADIISIESTTLTNIGNIGAAYGATTGTYFVAKVGAANGIVELKADARSGAYPPMVFTTGATERLRIDSSGNVGIGVTPSAWVSTVKALDISSGGAVYAGSLNCGLAANYYLNSSGNYIYKTTAFAAGYIPNYANNGSHVWFNAPSGTAGNAITFTQAMTLDASGRLLVGTTDAGSNSGIGLKAAYSATAPYFATVGSSNASNTYSYLLYSTTDAAFKFYVSYSGQISATSGTISAISDARLKENVQDIDVGLGAILALKPRKFDWKAGKGKDIKGDRGFIAQEFEQVFPNLIDEWKDPAPEGEAPYKSVRQDLIPVLVKAIQELTARVQTLETR